MEGLGRRSSTSPYPNTPSFLIQSLPLSCSFTIFFHLPLLLGPSISFTLLTSQTLHSSLSPYDQTISTYFFSSIPLHPIYLPLYIATFSHTLSLLSTFHLVTTHALLRQLISTTSTLDCCVLFHVQVSDPYVSVGKRILFLEPLFTSIDIFLHLITLASDPMTHLPFKAFSLFSISISPCLHSTVPKY